MVGRDLLHYRILSKLGQGGMGEVYLASDTRLGRRVAIKVLPPDLASDRERLERFEREARAVAALNHPNIVTIHSVEEAEGLRFLTMEAVEGRTLSQVIPSSGLLPVKLLDLAVPLADAISAAHAKGIWHRDLKPANVMVSDDGQIKVLDFGLAKLRPQLEEVPEATATPTLTQEGSRLGTMPYMSPEQAKGQPGDHRSDIFSLGIVLYELATGHRPFGGETQAELLTAILRDTPPPVSEINPDCPRQLGRIVAHCLEKEPDQRFQTALDLRNELDSLRREMQTQEMVQSSLTSVARPPRRWFRRPLGWALGALAVLVLLSVGYALRDRLPRGGETALEGAAAVGRPSLAVLYFRNLRSDPELDWLRTGLTEMLVTDLAQGRGLQILGTDRLYEILTDLDGRDRPLVASEIERLASRAEVANVLRGTFARVGRQLKIGITVQAARSGDVLFSTDVEGDLEGDLFALVDRLSGSVREAFEAPPAASPELDRRLEEVTTPSVEAYRYYVEGMSLHRQIKEKEALALFERAVELDPGFAMAYNRLSAIELNLGNPKAAVAYARRALENSERLPARERYFIEGSFYARRWETYGRAIQAFRKAIDLYPDHGAASHSLAIVLTSLERYGEAIELWERRLTEAEPFGGVYYSLVSAYGALGRRTDGERVVRRFEEQEPEGWYPPQVRGWHHVFSNEPEAAAAAFERAGERRPGASEVDEGRWAAAILADRWDSARAAAERLAASKDPFFRWRGTVSLGLVNLYRGRSAEALELFEAAAGSFAEESAYAAIGLCWAADNYLQLGRPGPAGPLLERARREGESEWPELEAMFHEALRAQTMGRREEAIRLAETLNARSESRPNAVEERFSRHLAGELALLEGDLPRALDELRAAQRSLPPRGVAWHWHRLPDHVAVWYALGRAQLEAGDAASAATTFAKVRDSGFARAESPVRYVRSFYFLGEAQRRLGEAEEARASFARFVELWGDGDLDRQRLAEARAFLR